MMTEAIHPTTAAPGTTAAWIEAARANLRHAFAARYPWPFLIGEATLHVPRRATRTLADPTRAGLDTLPPPPPGAEARTLLVLPIRKASELFAEMITVGRTSNHDLVVRDVTVSKFHAWLRIEDSVLWLVDAGSHNGTRVEGQQCAPRRAVCAATGSRIQFGSVELALESSATVWEMLRPARTGTATWRER